MLDMLFYKNRCLDMVSYRFVDGDGKLQSLEGKQGLRVESVHGGTVALSGEVDRFEVVLVAVEGLEEYIEAVLQREEAAWEFRNGSD